MSPFSFKRANSIAFARVLARKISAQGARCATVVALAVTFAPPFASATEVIRDGSTVRIRSTAIEAGWHTGRVRRDKRRCSMIQLDSPTEHGYTIIALMVVEALQLGRTGNWTAISPKQAIASEPPHCLVEGAD
jgi:hypothetical protein